MNVAIISPISFGYKDILKTEFKKGKLPTVKIDPMGSKLTKENATLDHFIPHSKGGSSATSNYLLMKNTNNWAKSNLPAKDTITPTGLKKYLVQFFDVVTDLFNGNVYVKNIVKNADKQGIDLGEEFKEIVSKLPTKK